VEINAYSLELYQHGNRFLADYQFAGLLVVMPVADFSVC